MWTPLVTMGLCVIPWIAGAQEIPVGTWPDSWRPGSASLLEAKAAPATPQVLPTTMDSRATRVFLGSAIGGFVGGYAGLWAGVLIADPCDLCWEAYAIGVAGNLLGAGKGAEMAGVPWSKALEGAVLGLGAAIGVTAAAVGFEAPDPLQIILFPLTQGLVTTLWALR